MVGKATVRLRSVRGGRSTAILLYIWTPVRAIHELERRKFRLLRVFLLALAGVADKAEAVSFCLLGREAVAFAVLPDAAAVTGDAVRPVVHVFAMPTAY